MNEAEGSVDGSPQQVFISYRREESAAYAGRIYDAMAARFGEENVFMDVEMPPGIDFVEQIDNVLSSCAALIVVIGPQWTEVPGGDGRPRLESPTDFVRREVAAALRRDDVTVIPALVGGAPMPDAAQLPVDLRPLTRRNALELSHGRWRYDVGRLNQTLDAVVPAHPVPVDRAPFPEPQASPRFVTWPAATRLLLEGMLIAAAAAFLGRLLGEQPNVSTDSTTGEILKVVVQRGATWGAVGLALAPWLGWRTKRSDFVYLAVLGLFFGLLAGILGGLAFALPHKLPNPPIDKDAEPGWGFLSVALSGAVIGAMLGSVWRPREILAGLLGGLAGGGLSRLLLKDYGWSEHGTAESGFTLSAEAAVVAAVALLALLAVGLALSYRSSPAATAPGSR